jgi:hypothetical protein
MIQQNFINKNRSFVTFNPQGIVLHETADPGATVDDCWNYFNNNDVNANAHCFVDWTRTMQTLPWKEKGWHSGQTANTFYIGVEMCRPSEHNEEQFNKVWKNTIWALSYIFGQVINEWRINDITLVSHKDISERYKEVDHVDPIAYLEEYGLTMEDVRKAVVKCMQENVVDDLFVKQDEVVTIPELMGYKKKYEELRVKYDKLIIDIIDIHSRYVQEGKRERRKPSYGE